MIIYIADTANQSAVRGVDTVIATLAVVWMSTLHTKQALKLRVKNQYYYVVSLKLSVMFVNYRAKLM